MYAKSLVFIIALVFFGFLPLPSHAQSWTASSTQNIDTSGLPNGTAVIISQEESSIPGYFHIQYAFVDQNCGNQMVDYYGPRIDPNDRRLVDQRLCTELAMNTRDGD